MLLPELQGNEKIMSGERSDADDDDAALPPPLSDTWVERRAATAFFPQLVDRHRAKSASICPHSAFPAPHSGPTANYRQ